MAHTGHGHWIPGSTKGLPLEVGVTTCGGPTVCPRCYDDVREYGRNNIPEFIPVKMKVDFPAKAKKILTDYIDSQYSESFEKPAFEVYIVWFAKVLQNWKALVITDRPDNKYYELTYDGAKRATYVVEYDQTKNTCIPD